METLNGCLYNGIQEDYTDVTNTRTSFQEKREWFPMLWIVACFNNVLQQPHDYQIHPIRVNPSQDTGIF